MPADAESFVIHPFQELVKIAKEAAANAEAGQSDDPERSKSMLKSARGLIKEGERALQKITPFGTPRVLEDLLYDLDDFIGVDTFDADKYSEVQAASKAFALSAMEAIRRLKIEDDSSALPSSPGLITPIASPSKFVFPPLPPLPLGKLESLSRPPTSQPNGPLLSVRSNPIKNGLSSPMREDASGREFSPSQNVAVSRTEHMSSTPRISEWVREQLSTSQPVIPEDSTSPRRHADRPATGMAKRDTLESSVLSEYDSAGPTSPASTSYRTSVFSDASSHQSSAKSNLQVPGETPKIPPLPNHFFNVFPTSSLEVPLRNPPNPALHRDSVSDGARISSRECVVNVPEPKPEKEPWYAKQAKCAVGPDSSFKALGGFCEGAFIFKESGGQAATVAGSEQQERRTPYESDATVFTTPEQLFRHLARHPQPLPIVDGFPVVYGEASPDDLAIGSFDLLFPNPPVANPLMEVDPTLLESLPTAVANMDHHVGRGERPSIDANGDMTLQFTKGARILGISFPEKWGGKQCTGWHDGARGTFPARFVSLLPPRKGAFRTLGMDNDGVTVTARWKWEPSDPGWLTFEKGATIRNVSWLNQDQWCWSGMTKDGKVGFFPQSHIKPESVKGAISSGYIPSRSKHDQRGFSIYDGL
ncbi:uncharacterized protein PG998_004010 [Apiospora kogelbergensis]|uniref:uncharacterized protein n=1 Tax=Apiospora kogelbergensis TaxID=1337665 RepID=UPI00313278B7